MTGSRIRVPVILGWKLCDAFTLTDPSQRNICSNLVRAQRAIWLPPSFPSTSLVIHLSRVTLQESESSAIIPSLSFYTLQGCPNARNEILALTQPSLKPLDVEFWGQYHGQIHATSCKTNRDSDRPNYPTCETAKRLHCHATPRSQVRPPCLRDLRNLSNHTQRAPKEFPLGCMKPSSCCDLCKRYD